MTQSPDIALSCSPFLERMVARHPAWLPDLTVHGRLENDLSPTSEHLDETIDRHGLDAGLRRFRNREMLRITWRELNRAATLQQTLADLSLLAELCLQSAIDHHHERLSGIHGAPLDHEGCKQRLVALGLGKLGGHELNLSSDIDLIFCFPSSGETAGPRRLANEQYFQRLARAAINSLSEVTGDGFCFRVDTRLRPFGESGPLVCSFGALEQYYQREGRDWERYALIKALPVAGDLEAGAGLVNTLMPFVYRRYIDFGAVEALREMRASVERDTRRKGRENDIKRGRGGIRDIEFLVQCLQLLRGGREPTLRTTSLLAALEQLEQLEQISRPMADTLRTDYGFLRRLENAIQALHDQQTHKLPTGEDLQRVRRVMGFDQAADLTAELERVRDRVSGAVAECFPDPPEGTRQQRSWVASTDEQPDPVLEQFRLRLDRNALSQRATERLNRFMPLLIDRLKAAETAQGARDDVLELVAGISRRSAYLSLLVENPGALQRMLDLFSNSDWIARTVIRYPALLDELIDPALGQALPDRAEMDRNVQRCLGSGQDAENTVLSLNHIKRSFSLRIAVAELAGRISAEAAQALLGDLASALLAGALNIASTSMAERHGALDGAGLAIVAYGSLGAGEMNYGSDLDLVFLYRRGTDPSSGQRPLATEQYYTRLARRMLGMVTVLTPAGRLYEVDTRLRPNGRAGMLVSSLPAFERYQLQDAWVWELQALVRARPLTGDSEVAEGFKSIRAAALGVVRDAHELRPAVREMRARMRSEIRGGDPLKHGPGGLVDIGFVAQLGVLECAATHPELIRHTATPELIAGLASAGWLKPAWADTLAATHSGLTRARRLRALSRGGNAESPDCSDSARICAHWLDEPCMEKEPPPG
jgi:glutamate-ammonia-ligase adenylyltransferase